MNILLWISQGLLAAMFLMAGLMKLSKPKIELSEKLGNWVDSYSLNTIKLIGLLEFLAAVGLILPLAINIFPILTPIAAIGLAVVMIGAMNLHYKRGEKDKIGMNLILFLLSVFVVFGRFYLVPTI
ncbi:MAG: DoxX family protein [Putridiphycobacter sp.]|nr:DoxX family protein [Putridiphycobacter sp.]